VIFKARGRTQLEAMKALWAKVGIRDVETREQYRRRARTGEITIHASAIAIGMQSRLTMGTSVRG
jgi:hypothetical protein